MSRKRRKERLGHSARAIATRPGAPPALGIFKGGHGRATTVKDNSTEPDPNAHVDSTQRQIRMSNVGQRIAAPFTALLAALGIALTPPPDLASGLKSLPDIGALPSPWATWMLFALLHFVRLRTWAKEALQSRMDLISKAHRRRKREQFDWARGVLPGLPDWEYCLFSTLEIVTHRDTRQVILFDRSEEPGLISWSTINSYLASHRDPAPVLRKLAELHPGSSALPLAFENLWTAGVIHEKSAGVFSLCDEVVKDAESISLFLERWSNATPAALVWQAAAIGDWPAAHEAAPAHRDPEILELTGRRAEQTVRQRRQDLRASVARFGLRPSLLHALADAGAKDLSVHVWEASKVLLDHDPAEGTPYRVTTGDGPMPLFAAALEIVEDDPSLVEDEASYYAKFTHTVFAALVAEGVPASELLMNCAAYLARVDHNTRDVIERLAECGQDLLGDAAILALEYVPDLAISLLRRALRDSSQWVRLPAAAALGLVDLPWSRRELIAVLEESDDADATIECKEALRTSAEPAAAWAVSSWERSHSASQAPRPSFAQQIYTVGGGCEALLADSMRRLRTRIGRIRHRMTDDGPV